LTNFVLIIPYRYENRTEHPTTTRWPAPTGRFFHRRPRKQRKTAAEQRAGSLFSRSPNRRYARISAEGQWRLLIIYCKNSKNSGKCDGSSRYGLATPAPPPTPLKGARSTVGKARMPTDLCPWVEGPRAEPGRGNLRLHRDHNKQQIFVQPGSRGSSPVMTAFAEPRRCAGNGRCRPSSAGRVLALRPPGLPDWPS
jgi:hypothetical protein